MTVKKLTARGVKTMLARAGVDYSALDITEDSAIWRDLDGGNPRTSVVIKGPKDVRNQVWSALEDRGLVCAPYTDRDEWSRR